MFYFFRYRRKSVLFNFFSFWRKIKVKGHMYDGKQNKMILYLPSGKIREICYWSDCEINLREDWVIYSLQGIKKETGINIDISEIDSNEELMYNSNINKIRQTVETGAGIISGYAPPKSDINNIEKIDV